MRFFILLALSILSVCVHAQTAHSRDANLPGNAVITQEADIMWYKLVWRYIDPEVPKNNMLKRLLYNDTTFTDLADIMKKAIDSGNIPLYIARDSIVPLQTRPQINADSITGYMVMELVHYDRKAQKVITEILAFGPCSGGRKSADCLIKGDAMAKLLDQCKTITPDYTKATAWELLDRHYFQTSVVKAVTVKEEYYIDGKKAAR